MMSGLDLERGYGYAYFYYPTKVTHPSIHPSIHPNSTLATLYCPTNRVAAGSLGVAARAMDLAVEQARNG